MNAPLWLNPNEAMPMQQAPQEQAGSFDFQAREAALLQRKRLLAQMMRAQLQAQSPQGQMVGQGPGAQFVAPNILQHFAASIMPAISTQLADRNVTQAQSEFDQNDRRAAIAHAMERPRQDAPQQIGGYGQTNEVQGPAPTAQQMSAWAQRGMAIPSRRETMARLIQDMEINEPIRQEARRNRVEDREDAQRSRSDQLASNEQLRREQLQRDEAFRRDKLKSDEDLARQRMADAAEMRRLVAAGQADARADRRATIQAALDGKSASESASQAKERQEIAEQARNAQERMELLNSAMQAGKTATGSGAGAVADKLASIVGWSTEGARGAAKLKAYQAQLLTLTPKLGGATSDADVRNYREAVGQIGDETLPMATRQAAMDTVQTINQRDYDNALERGRGFNASTKPKAPQAPSAPAAPAGPRIPRVSGQADVDRLPSGATFIGEDGKTYRKQ
jgi:hypothetical protein